MDVRNRADAPVASADKGDGTGALIPERQRDEFGPRLEPRPLEPLGEMNFNRVGAHAGLRGD